MFFSTRTRRSFIRNGLTSLRHGVASSAGVGFASSCSTYSSAEALDQGVLDLVLDLPAQPDQVRQPGGVRAGHEQTRLVAWPPDRVHRGVGRRQRQQLGSELTGQPTREERGDADPEAGYRADRVGGEGGGHELTTKEGHACGC